MGPIQVPSLVCPELEESESDCNSKIEFDTPEYDDDTVVYETLEESKKQQLLTESDETALKCLRSAYDALETQAWIGGSLQQVNEITLTFNHQETCVLFEKCREWRGRRVDMIDSQEKDGLLASQPKRYARRAP
jgi:hypothetical protein